MTGVLTDIEIIEGCKKQDRKVQGYLYKRYYSDFLKICLRYAGAINDAEQWLNDGFYKVFTKIHLYDGNGSFEGWMKRIIINTCLDSIRNDKKHRSLVFTEVTDNNSAAHTAQVGNDALQNIGFKEIVMLLHQLPETHLVVFNLYVFEGYSHKEIADSLGIREGTSYWYMNKAREILKQKLTQYQLKIK